MKERLTHLKNCLTLFSYFHQTSNFSFLLVFTSQFNDLQKLKCQNEESEETDL